MKARTHAVTGVFGYSGQYIAERLLAKGERVITLTGSPSRQSVFGDAVKAYRFDFDDPARLEQTLSGVSVLYNTYWVRFNHKRFTHERAVRNSRVLFEAARRAGVERIVHVSITNPSLDSPLSYFRGKAEVEQALRESGVSHAILRPAVLFGKQDILMNNIAWALRRFPIFGVFGNGAYSLAPIYVGDFAQLAVDQGEDRTNGIINALGPETFTYRELVQTIGNKIGKQRPIVSMPHTVGWLLGWLIGKLKGDVMITMDEIRGLTEDLLNVEAGWRGKTSLTAWLDKHKETVGRSYTSEMARRLDRRVAYQSN